MMIIENINSIRRFSFQDKFSKLQDDFLKHPLQQ